MDERTGTGDVGVKVSGLRAWPVRAGVVSTVLIVVALLLGACGGAGSPASVAHIGKSSPTTTVAPPAGSGGLPNLQQMYEDGLAYARCMRSHGDPSFPDPELVNNAHERGIAMDQGVDRNSPQYQAANKKCEHLLPNNGNGPTQAQLQQMMARALKYTDCMRSHGVPSFPDPKESSGGISIGGPGLDPNSPQFQTAQTDCRSLTPGG
jgi:hypothetical protein